MNRGPLLFLGIFFTMSLSWVAFVLAPQLQFGAQLPDKLDNLARFSSRSAWQAKALGQPVKDEGSGPMYPTPRTGLAQRGLQVYRANGCYYCHSQQVRQ